MLLQGFFLGHNAFAYLFNNPCMVFRELPDLLTVDEVSKAITGIGNVDGIVFEDGCYTCCAHTAMCAFLLILMLCRINLVDEPVSLLKRVLEGRGYISAAILVVGISDDMNGHLTGQIALGMSSHAVRHHKQGAFRAHHRCILWEHRQHIV